MKQPLETSDPGDGGALPGRKDRSMQDLTGGSSRRVEEIDIVKAIAIMLMVACHAGVSFARFNQMFHMAIFFIAAGFFFRDSSSDSLCSTAKTIWSKYRKLVILFFLWNTVFVLLHNPLTRTNIIPAGAENVAIPTPDPSSFYTAADIVKRILLGLLFGYREFLIGGFWFFRVLFLITAAYCAIDFLLKKLTKGNRWAGLGGQFIASATLLFVGWHFSRKGQDFFSIPHVCSFYCLYFLGHLLALARSKYINWKWPIYLAILILSFGLLLYLNTRGYVGYNLNDYYPGPLYMLCCAFTGWCWLYSMAWFLQKIPVVSTVLKVTGQKTLSVLILHLPVLKVIQIIQALYFKTPLYGLASFPSVRSGNTWWCLLYVALATAIPVLLDVLYRRLTSPIFKKGEGR